MKYWDQLFDYYILYNNKSSGIMTYFGMHTQIGHMAVKTQKDIIIIHHQEHYWSKKI